MLSLCKIHFNSMFVLIGTALKYLLIFKIIKSGSIISRSKNFEIEFLRSAKYLKHKMELRIHLASTRDSYWTMLFLNMHDYPEHGCLGIFLDDRIDSEKFSVSELRGGRYINYK
jgi:hypothetical protein